MASDNRAMTTDLLRRLRSDGFSVRLDHASDPRRLLVKPIAKLAGELRDLVIAHRLGLMAALLEEDDQAARLRAIDAVALPDLDEANPVVLDTFVLLRLHRDDEPPEYLAVHPDWLEGLREFSRIRKRERAEAEARREERGRALARRNSRKKVTDDQRTERI